MNRALYLPALCLPFELPPIIMKPGIIQEGPGMATEQRDDAGRTIIEEMRQIIAFAEEATGLSSRWNGGLLILEDDMGAAQMAQMLSRVPYLAEKEWSCSITVVGSTLQDDQRRRTLLHECLHSVSVGLTQESYDRFAPWEEAVVEGLQRLYRPLLFQQLGLDVSESRFTALEAIWPYNSAMEALNRIAAERPEAPIRDFLEAMLRTPLPGRPAFAFEWGRQAADFAHFKRVYAAASGLLR